LKIFNKLHFQYFIKQLLFCFLVLFFIRALFIITLKNESFQVLELTKAFLIGLFFDASVLSIVFLLQLLFYVFIWKIKRKAGLQFLKYSSIFLITLIVLIILTNSIIRILQII